VKQKLTFLSSPLRRTRLVDYSLFPSQEPLYSGPKSEICRPLRIFCMLQQDDNSLSAVVKCLTEPLA